MPVMQFSERPYGNLAGFRFCSNGRLVGFWRLAAIGIAGGETRRQTFCYKETPKHLNLTWFFRNAGIAALPPRTAITIISPATKRTHTVERILFFRSACLLSSRSSTASFGRHSRRLTARRHIVGTSPRGTGSRFHS